MRVALSRRPRGSAIAAVLAAALVPHAAWATVVEGQRVMPRVGSTMRTTAPAATTVWRAARPGAHVLYGTIAAVNAMMVSLRLRSGQLVAVDATAAINGGNYSAPLFVGKIVTVDGEVIAGKFSATHIFRMSNLANLPADR